MGKGRRTPPPKPYARVASSGKENATAFDGANAYYQNNNHEPSSMDAAPLTLSQQYRKLALQIHPDKQPLNDKIDATRAFQILSNLYRSKCA
jgi:hypothetical protein